MGMFDWINFECDCPKCGKKVTGFQSKDGPCELKTLKPSEVECYYSNCSCGEWITFKNKKTEDSLRSLLWECLQFVEWVGKVSLDDYEPERVDVLWAKIENELKKKG